MIPLEFEEADTSTDWVIEPVFKDRTAALASEVRDTRTIYNTSRSDDIIEASLAIPCTSTEVKRKNNQSRRSGASEILEFIDSIVQSNAIRA